ncbi:olfactory receptor 11L1-like [Anomaloglossus baeobatrachus]
METQGSFIKICILQDMERNNVTSVFLLGFPGLHTFRIVLFLLLIIIYITTICGNLLVISLVSSIKSLHCPMYFFLTQLTTSDIILSSDIVPNMLFVVLNNGSSITLSACITQLFFFAYSEASECFLLTVMSYDRYTAICHPLHYESIMSSMVCLKLIISSWFLGFSAALTQSVNVSQLHFCRSNVIDHFFCEIDPLLDLSCSSVFMIKNSSSEWSTLQMSIYIGQIWYQMRHAKYSWYQMFYHTINKYILTKD